MTRVFLIFCLLPFILLLEGVFAIILLLQSWRKKRMKIYEKMFLLACLFPIGLSLVLGALHFPFILIGSLSALFVVGCIMLGGAWQREEDEKAKSRNKTRNKK